MLETPLDDLILACVEQRLGELAPIAWKSGTAVCVVMASGGYPGNYAKDKVISGITEAEALGVTVFHAGTKAEGDRTLTDGGRVLGVTATGESFEAAIRLVYQAVGCIQFEGQYYRRDIGHRARQ